MSIPYDYDPLGVGNRGGDEGYIVFSDGVRDYRLSGNFDALTDGNWMLGTATSASIVKPRLTEWSIALPNLTKGDYMFTGRGGLTSFSSDLPSLTSGSYMFMNCNLDETSVLRILNSIPSCSSGSRPLHLGKRTNYLNSAEVASLLGTTTPIAATNYEYKGWTITVTT